MAKLDFRNQVWIVTGAASGMGREVALQSAQAGADVQAIDWNAEGLEETLRIAGSSRVSMQGHRIDLADASLIKTFAEELIPTLAGRKLVLINNAGVALRSGTFAQTELEDFEWLLDINLRAPLRLSKAFLPYMLERNDGHIVNLSSVFGIIGMTLNSAYCTSKFALRGFTETLRMELYGTRISTTCVHPGGIRTNIVRNARVTGGSTEAEQVRTIASFEKQAMTSAAAAAKQILYAVHRRKPRLLIGIDAVGIDLMARLLPVAYTKLIAARLRKVFAAD